MHNVRLIILVAGIIAALPGISNLMAAPALGAVGRSDRIRKPGQRIDFCRDHVHPSRYCRQYWALGFLRHMIGVSDCLIPDHSRRYFENDTGGPPAPRSVGIIVLRRSYQR